MNVPDQQVVADVVRNLLAAVASGDRDAIRANHAPDLLMFDFPDTVRGMEEYDAQWDFFYDNQTAPVTFEPEDLQVSAGDRVAFTTCLVHCAGTTGGDFRFRLTVGLEKRAGAWLITHEHHSLPTREPGLIMPEKHEALGIRTGQ